MTYDDEFETSPAEGSYPADQLVVELREARETPPDAHERGGGDDDGIGDQLLYLLDSELFDVPLTEEIDHLLFDSDRLTSRLNQALMRGADQGLTERRGARSDLGDLRAEIDERLETVRRLELDAASTGATKRAKLEAFVRRMQKGPVPFGDLEPADVAYWVVNFGIRADLLLSAVDPQHMEAGEPGKPQAAQARKPVLLKAQNEPWRVFKKHVRELVNESYSGQVEESQR